MMVRQCAFCLLILIPSSVAALSVNAAEYQGVSIEIPDGYDQGLLDESILDLRQIGANTIAVDLNWTQSSLTDSPDVASIEEKLTQISPVIDAVQDRGLNVFLRSNVIVDSGTFSGRIAPAQPSQWFDAYGKIMESVAELANQKDVSMLSIGSNLNQLEGLTSNWQSLIGSVRERYSGVLTYAADATGDEELGGGFRDLPWWNEVDVVGVNAFLPLSFDFNAVPEELNGVAVDWADEFDFWLDGSGLDKQLLITDTGYRSQDGGAVFPLERAGDRVDLEEQSLAYDAVLGAFGSRDWWAGAFVTGWQADPHAGGAGDNGFSPQNKPAEAVLAEQFGGRATFAVRPSLLESWEAGFNGWRLPNSPPSATGPLMLEVENGASDGETSLSIPSGDSSRLTATKIWTLDGSEAYTLFQQAFRDSSKYAIELDVTINTDDVPGNATTMLFSLQDDLDNPSVVSLPVSFDGSGLQSQTVAASLESFGNLKPDSIYYELQLGTNNSWNGVVFIDNLRLISNVLGDVTNDTIVDCGDIDAISDALRHGWDDSQYDVNSDGVVDAADRDAWLEVANSLSGDFDLNGKVEFADFLVLSNNFAQPGNWCDGDATEDREINFADFLILSANFGQTAAAATSVPEPGSIWLLLCAVPFALRQRNRNATQITSGIRVAA